MSSKTVTLEMVKEAQGRLAKIALHTAMPHSNVIIEKCKSDVYLKLENLQRTGSFKLRGAYNKIATMSEAEKEKGIVAASAGNHAQGVALGAQAYGVKATICMPKTAPLSKVNATRSYGANVVLEGDFFSGAYAKAQQLEKEDGLTFCHPYDDPMVIAGQGTIALEILEDLPEADAIVVPIGGGGLIAGIALAAKSVKPSIRIIGVQTANMPSMKASVEGGKITTVECKASLADGITVSTPGTLTYDIVREYVDEIVTVTEDEISETILFLLEKAKCVSEGAGACPAAAILHNKIAGIEGKKVVAMVSGGNIDVNMVGRIINNGLVKSWRKVYFDAVVPDRPYVLANLTRTISDTGANILSIYHDRSQRDTGIGYVHVSVELETVDEDHVHNMIDTLRMSGITAVIK